MSAEYALVYPFVVVESQGGPFRDEDYVCGVEFGGIAAKLKTAPPEATVMRFTVHSSNLPMLDLAAADSGFRMSTEPWADDPSWTFAWFHRNTEMEMP